jgi:hypothetical protein
VTSDLFGLFCVLPFRIIPLGISESTIHNHGINYPYPCRILQFTYAASTPVSWTAATSAATLPPTELLAESSEKIDQAKRDLPIRFSLPPAAAIYGVERTL